MNGTLTYVVGDALASKVVGWKVIPHICNDSGGWGMGFVVAISKKWKKPEEQYRQWFSKKEFFRKEEKVLFELGNVQLVVVEENVIVANMIAQHQTVSKTNPRPIRYDSLIKCMETIRDRCVPVIVSGKNIEIHAPKFGAGLAQGNWNVIEQLIIEFWVNAGIKVVIYEFPGKT
jgi:hypothetical protein